MSLKNVIDSFIPEQLRGDIEVLSRARITVTVMFTMTIILFLNFFRPLRIGRVDIAIYTASAAILIGLGPLIMKYLKSQLIAANYFLTISVALVTFVTIDRGGIIAYFTMNYAIVIVIAFLTTNLKNGIIWGVICCSILAIMKIAEVNGVQFNAVTGDAAHINILMFIGMITVLAAIYAWNSTKNLKRFAQEKDLSDKSAKALKIVLGETSAVMSAVAKGDLSRRIDSEIEGELASLKISVNKALALLGNSVVQVLGSSYEINNGTNELSSASQDLASGTSEQAASLEEIASSMEEIGSRAKTNDKDATQAQVLSNQAVVDLEKGNKQMESMLVAMKTISETSANVSKVIKVIDEIAFQTNLLALNASVEAARAGKYGKGFAVVAEEVRNLAARSAEAAKNTTDLIESSIINVENGVKNANITAETLQSFVESINQVNNIVGEISAASREQTVSVNEINVVLNQLNDVVQRNSSISEETASFSEELSSQAEVLQNLMNKFKLRSNQYTSSLNQQTQQIKKIASPHSRIPQ